MFNRNLTCTTALSSTPQTFLLCFKLQESEEITKNNLKHSSRFLFHLFLRFCSICLFAFVPIVFCFQVTIVFCFQVTKKQCVSWRTQRTLLISCLKHQSAPSRHVIKLARYTLDATHARRPPNEDHRNEAIHVTSTPAINVCKCSEDDFEEPPTTTQPPILNLLRLLSLSIA